MYGAMRVSFKPPELASSFSSFYPVGSPRCGMVVPTFRGGLPSSLEALPQTHPMVCLLGDSKISLDPVQIIVILL